MRGAECSHHHNLDHPRLFRQVAENSQRKNYDCVKYRGRAALQRRVEYQNKFGLQPQWSHVVSTRVVRQPLDFPSVNLCVPPCLSTLPVPSLAAVISKQPPPK